jgi:hypothetical protein
VRRLVRKFPYVDDALQSLEWSLRRTPFSEGELSEAWPGREIRWTIVPGTPRFPDLRTVFEILDPHVHCWAVGERT